jgi:hypothetical protein
MWKLFLSSVWCIRVAAILGMALSLPSLTAGFNADDFFHREVLTGRFNNDHPGSLLGMFSFADGNLERAHEFMQKGIYPWWTTDAIRLSFWRPLAEFTHWIDYRFWPDSPMLMHAQNIFWYGALIIAMGVWLRAIDSNKLRASVATLIYGISAMHGTAIGWIASRNALIAAFFGVLCLIGFHYARQGDVSSRQRRVFYGASLVTFLLSLLAGESAIAVTAYLFAYVLFLDKNSRMLSRISGLLPYAAIVVVWKYIYSHLGYGSYGSGAYIDPATEMGRFIPLAAMRVPALLAAQIFGVPSILHNYMPSSMAQIAYSAIAVIGLSLFLISLYTLNLHRDKNVRFYGLAMLLASIPISATIPDDRLLTLVGLGGAALLAAFFCAVVDRFKTLRGGRRVAIAVLVGYLALLHFVVMPALLPSNVRIMTQMLSPYLEHPVISLPEEKFTNNTRLMFINSPLPSCVSYLPFVRSYYGLRHLQSAMAMAPGSRRMFLEVIDDKTLQITVPEGFLPPMDNFFRDPQLRFNLGDQIDLGGISVTVIQVLSDGQPDAVKFQFEQALQDPNLQFFIWNKDKYSEFKLPSVGRKIEIAAFDFENPTSVTVR